ncbi:MAG: hypothetical protein IPI49_09695 [Myxococcales bacterium]|nr:hypothetical protein [Myxococcales bacterium]
MIASMRLPSPVNASPRESEELPLLRAGGVQEEVVARHQVWQRVGGGALHGEHLHAVLAPADRVHQVVERAGVAPRHCGAAWQGGAGAEEQISRHIGDDRRRASAAVDQRDVAAVEVGDDRVAAACVDEGPKRLLGEQAQRLVVAQRGQAMLVVAEREVLRAIVAGQLAAIPVDPGDGRVAAHRHDEARGAVAGVLHR